jgi:hypothetical protein
MATKTIDARKSIDDGKQLGGVSAADIMSGNPYSVSRETTLGTLVHVLWASDLIFCPIASVTPIMRGLS